MYKLRNLIAGLIIVVCVPLLAGCGKGSHSGGMENPSPAVKAKGQLDGSVEATGGP